MGCSRMFSFAYLPSSVSASTCTSKDPCSVSINSLRCRGRRRSTPRRPTPESKPWRMRADLLCLWLALAFHWRRKGKKNENYSIRLDCCIHTVGWMEGKGKGRKYPSGSPSPGRPCQTTNKTISPDSRCCWSLHSLHAKAVQSSISIVEIQLGIGKSWNVGKIRLEWRGLALMLMSCRPEEKAKRPRHCLSLYSGLAFALALA